MITCARVALLQRAPTRHRGFRCRPLPATVAAADGGDEARRRRPGGLGAGVFDGEHGLLAVRQRRGEGAHHLLLALTVAVGHGVTDLPGPALPDRHAADQVRDARLLLLAPAAQ